MTKPALIIIMLFFLFVFACSDVEKPIQTSDNVSDCSFSKLKDIIISKEIKNGQEITIKGAIEANIDILKKKFGNVEISIEDNIALNKTIETIDERITYDQKFRSNHDAIVQILCSLEKDLEKEKLETERKKKLFDDYDEMRRKYFRYLIGERQKNTDATETNAIEETTVSPLKIVKENPEPKVKLKSFYVVSNTDMKGTYLKIPQFKDIRVNSEYQQVKIPANTALEDLYLYDKKGNKWQSTPRGEKIIFSSNNLILTNE